MVNRFNQQDHQHHILYHLNKKIDLNTVVSGVIFKMATTAAMLKIHDGPISRFFQTAFGLNCTKFHAFITMCTSFQLSRPTIRNDDTLF